MFLKRFTSVLLLVVLAMSFTSLLTLSVSSQPLSWRYKAPAEVYSVAVSADGNYIIAGTKDNNILFFDKELVTGRELWKTTAVRSVVTTTISSDGNYVAAGSDDAVVYFFDRDFTANRALWQYMVKGPAKSVSISGDGKYLAAGSYDRRIYLFDRKFTNKAPLWYYIAGDQVSSVAISRDGNYIAAASRDRYVYSFDKEYTGQTFRWRFLTEAEVLSVAISADGSSIAAGSMDTYFYFAEQNFAKGTYSWRLKTGGKVNSVAVSGDGNYIAAGSDDGFVYLCDRKFTGNNYLWRFQTGGKVLSVGVDYDGSNVMAGSADNYVYLFDRKLTAKTYLWRYLTGQNVEERAGGGPFDADVYSVSISDTAEYMAAGSEDSHVYFFAAPTGEQITTETTPTTTQATTTVVTTVVTTKGMCIIASAAYGSELSPAVQALRTFRDKLVLSTFAGTEFMKAFNAWYYSFSPTVAGYVASSPALRAVVRAIIHPLIGILQLSTSAYAALSFNRELGIVVAGLVASGLIGLAYHAPWLTVLLGYGKRRRGFVLHIRSLKPFIYAWIGTLAVIGVAEILLAETLMIIATAAFVLLTIALTATISATLIVQKLIRTRKN